MATIINNPSGSEDSSVGVVVGLIVAVILIVLFILFVWPGVSSPAPGVPATGGTSGGASANVNLTLPSPSSGSNQSTHSNSNSSPVSSPTY